MPATTDVKYCHPDRPCPTSPRQPKEFNLGGPNHPLRHKSRFNLYPQRRQTRLFRIQTNPIRIVCPSLCTTGRVQFNRAFRSRLESTQFEPPAGILCRCATRHDIGRLSSRKVPEFSEIPFWGGFQSRNRSTTYLLIKGYECRIFLVWVAVLIQHNVSGNLFVQKSAFRPEKPQRRVQSYLWI